MREVISDNEQSANQPDNAQEQAYFKALVPNKVYRLVRSNRQIAKTTLVDRAVLKAKAVSSFLWCSCESRIIVRIPFTSAHFANILLAIPVVETHAFLSAGFPASLPHNHH